MNLFKAPPVAIPALFAALFGLGSPAAWAGGARSVVINGTQIGEDKIRALEQTYRVRILDGDYWYDRATGAWGLRGGPTAGLILPGLDLGGALRADASGGGTGVFINGRELHPLDVAGLQQLVGTVVPGRYWVDAYGNCGYEGGPVLVNLVYLAQASGRAGGPWSVYSRTGESVGGDGQGFSYFMGKDSSGNVISWSSGP